MELLLGALGALLFAAIVEGLRNSRHSDGPLNSLAMSTNVSISPAFSRVIVLVLMLLPLLILSTVPGLFLAIFGFISLFVALPLIVLSWILRLDFGTLVLLMFLIWVIGTIYVIAKHRVTRDDPWVYLMQGNLTISMLVLWAGEYSLFEHSKQYIGPVPIEGRIAVLLTGLAFTIAQALMVFQPREDLIYIAPGVDQLKAAVPEPLDLDDETGYCEHCGRFSPSRDGQCITCGSAVEGG